MERKPVCRLCGRRDFLCKSGRQMNRFITCVMQCVFTKLSGLLKFPRLNERSSEASAESSSSSLILLLPALPLDTGEDLFSSPPIMPCLVFQARKRVCVCGKSTHTHTHIDNTVRDTQRLKYTHTHLNTNIEKGTKNHTEPRLSGCCIRTEKHPLLQLLLLKLTTFR